MKYQDYKPLRFTNSQIQKAKNFPISDLIASYGLLNGAKKAKQGYFIINPFEDEKTASFLINTSASKNYAKAFNNSKGYDTISFSMNYENISFVSAVKKILNLPSENNFIKSANTNSNKPNKTTTKASDLKPLTDKKKLIALKYYYLEKERFISAKFTELHGLQYMTNGKYFYLAIANDKKGFDVKNRLGKWCFGAKSITTIIAKEKTNNFTVFEAYLDYLSFLILHNLEHLETNVIILHGTSQTSQTIAKISTFKPSKVFLALDIDKAGKEAKELFKKEFGSKIIDLSYIYKNHKDVNELLQSRKGKPLYKKQPKN